MKKTITAKPTTFEGVEFRSKSEAIFAVALDDIPNAVWQYEPKLNGFSFDVDFMLFCSNGRNAWSVLIEYKPCAPSKSYIEKCVESYRQFNYLQSWQSEFCQGFWIVYGSPFTDCKLEAIAVHEFLDSSVSFDMADFLQQRFIEAKKYRFDLA